MFPTSAANTYKEAPSHIVRMIVKGDMLKVNPMTKRKTPRQPTKISAEEAVV
jgi:hypothetical protein